MEDRNDNFSNKSRENSLIRKVYVRIKCVRPREMEISQKHMSISTTEKYLASFEDEQKKEIASLLTKL